MSIPTKTAFVLAGGGSLGAVQVGMLQVLLEHGVGAGLVVGSSVGALSAAHFAAEPTLAGVQRLKAVWARVRREDVFPLARLRALYRFLFGRDALLDPGSLRRLIAGALPLRRLEDATIPCTVIATDLLGGTEVRLTSGSAADALLASAAIPGCFRPCASGSTT
ncbi:MAG: patatin-like phospholipase family protein [Deferrisomatales bacterium]|nr:patatin-like phospholipase family protein [Deferrisomatales bacterium]